MSKTIEYLEPYYIIYEKHDELIDAIKSSNSLINLANDIMTEFNISYYNTRRVLDLFSSYLTNKELIEYAKEYKRNEKMFEENNNDTYLGESNDIFKGY